MYNTLYEDENHGLDLWKEKQARSRAAAICRRARIQVTQDQLDALDLKQIKRIIREGLAVLESRSSVQ